MLSVKRKQIWASARKKLRLIVCAVRNSVRIHRFWPLKCSRLRASVKDERMSAEHRWKKYWFGEICSSTTYWSLFEKLREASISFMSVRLSFRTEQLGSHGMNFSLNLIFEYFFRKPAEIIPIVIKSWQDKQALYIKTPSPPRKSCRLWENVEKFDRAGQAGDENVIQTQALSVLDKFGTRCTLGICNTYCFSTVTMGTRTRLSVKLYVHWLSS